MSDEVVQDPEAVAFGNTLAAATPRVMVTWLIVAICVGVFVAMVASTGSIDPNGQQLIEWGANFGMRTMDGQWWRLVSSAFLHLSILHLLLNMWVLASAGPLIERLMGNVAFLVAYLLCGISGSLVSLCWNPGLVSGGASGAIFGIYGVLGAYLLRQSDAIPISVLEGLKKSTSSFVIYNLIFGLSMDGIDNGAHIGGLVMGFVMGLVMATPLGVPDLAGTRLKRLAPATVLALGLGFGLYLALPRSVGELNRLMAWYDEREKKANAVFNDLSKQGKDGTMDDPTFAVRLSKDVMPVWNEILEKTQAFPRASLRAEGPRKTYDFLLDFAKLRIESLAHLEKAARTGDAKEVAQFQATQERINQLVGNHTKKPKS